MTIDPQDMLRSQFDLTWRLAEYHLPALTDAACLWEPAPGCWTVRQGPDRLWRPDWADAEPDPPPTVTIGWLSWHLIWWWSSALAAVRGETQTPREELFWPGNAAEVIQSVEMLATHWLATLEGLTPADLERPVAYPWPDPRPLAQVLGWVNLELMKNVAEIGYARLLYQNSRNSPSRPGRGNS
jgi:hypothetical protein